MGRPRASTVVVETPERILEAASDAFGRDGFERTRLADVAAAVGIRRPSLLYHFPSKEALYGAVVRRAFARLDDALRASLAVPAEFAVAMDRAAAAYASFLEEHEPIARLILRELIDARGPGAELLLREIVPLLDLMESFVLDAGRDAIAPGLPVRAAILQIAVGALVHAAAGPVRDPLWGVAGDRTRELVAVLFSTRSREPSAKRN